MAPARASEVERQGRSAGAGLDPAGTRLASPRLGGGTAGFRRALAWSLGLAGLAAYNWWILVPLKPGLMTSPDELFSNLEISGQPYAAAMQHADLLSGVLLAGAFLAVGRRSVPGGARDWLAMLAFAIAGAIGGLFPEVCADGISATCRRQEWHFQLPSSQYVHMLAGIAEFAAITVALFLALRRTRGSQARTAGSYRWLWRGALACYPLLGLAYLLNRMGGVMEAVFFVGFTVMVLTQIAERATAARSTQVGAQTAVP
jgi:hypothetical protein